MDSMNELEKNYSEGAQRYPVLFRFFQPVVAGESNGQSLRRIDWIRNNVLVVCPHCGMKDFHPIRIARTHNMLVLCRGEECGQGFHLLDTELYDLNNQRILDEYPLPKFLIS